MYYSTRGQQWVLLCAVLCTVAVATTKGKYVIEDDSFGSGDDVFHLKVIRNMDTGEHADIIVNAGAKIEELLLMDRISGTLRSVLDTYGRNATAVKNNDHFRNDLLLPYANRIANGTYVFNNTRYNLPMNEPQRNNSIHGLAYDKVFSIVDSQAEEFHAQLTLQYVFDNVDQGWPFHMELNVTYRLGDDGFQVTISAKNLDPTWGLPFYNSQHPYFSVSDVSKAIVTLDPCTEWNHVDVYNSSNIYSNLIPDGRTHKWIKFDGSPIGGSRDSPTYYDDEFKALRPCPEGYRHTIRDGKMNIILWQDSSYPYVQIFTGAQSGWQSSSIALEPMSGKCDAFNNHDGIHVISGGETFTSSYGIQIYSS